MKSSRKGIVFNPRPFGVILEDRMTVSIAHLQPIVALIAGIVILIMPRMLNYIVAFYLIVTGLLGLGLLR